MTGAASLRLPHPRRGVVALAATFLVAAGGCGGGGAPESDRLGAVRSGVVTDPARDVAHVSLPDVAAGGAAFPLRAERGGLLLLYFGFTNCPDLCPTTLSAMRTVRRDLGADAARVQVAMATVDPARDTAEVLVSYLRNFFDDAHALRTEDTAGLHEVEDAFGIVVTTQATDEPGYYTVDHKASLYAIDAEGRVVVEWPQGTSRDAIAADVRSLLQGGPIP